MSAALYEREHEHEALSGAIEQARGGAGGVVIVEGAAGIGKTALLAAAGGRARAEGFTVLRARGAEVEGSIGFGIVRQLFEDPLVHSDPDERVALTRGLAGAAVDALGLDPTRGFPAAPPATEPHHFHGLFWLCANLAERSPVLLAVDDAQWSDSASLHWLGYLGRRIEDVPVVLVVGVRAGEPEEDRPIPEIGADPGVRRLRPAPLTPAGIAAVVAETFAAEAEPAFVQACHAASGGVPFFAREIVAAARADGIPPTAAAAAGIARLRPTAIGASILLRLRRASDAGVGLARAVAVLGADAELRHAAALAGLEIAAAQLAADEVADMGILERPGGGRPLAFLHPVLRSAVYYDLPPGLRSQMHRNAADLLHADGAAAGAVAGQLMACEPSGDAAVARRLTAAADAESSPAAAAALLRRALAEPPPSPQRHGTLVALARAEMRLHDPAAIGHLQQARSASTDPLERAELGLALAWAHNFHLGESQALDVAAEVRAELGAGPPDADPDRVLVLRAGLAHLDARAPLRQGELADLLRAAEPAGTPARRAALAMLVLKATLAAQLPATRTIRLSERVIAGGCAPEQELEHDHLSMAVIALVYADAADRALGVNDALLDWSQTHGLEAAVAWNLLTSALVRRGTGQIRDALAEARAAAAHAEVLGWTYVHAVAHVYIASCLLDGGETDAATSALAESGFDDDSPPSQEHALFLLTRAKLRALRGAAGDAIADLEQCGRHLTHVGFEHPFLPWRSRVGALYAATGDGDRARELIGEEIALARRLGVDHSLGVALRALGLVAGGEEGLEHLRLSVERLGSSPAALERARSLVEYGAALRRARRRAEAREPLRLALDLASRLGATAVAQRAQDELAATGARPRRATLSGLEALTPSERRVARLAAQGRSNREIAQELFVSVRTVEAHLRGIFAKLDLSSRTELPERLSA